MKRHPLRAAAKVAIPYALPLLPGFLFLGMAYGVLMRSAGFDPWYPIVMSLVIFAGAMQFVAIDLLSQPFAPLSVFVLTLLVNARHIFYGISLLDKYRDAGKKKVFLIFALCDETFSINYSVQAPERVDRSWFYFFVTIFNYIFWNVGVMLGAVFGGFLTFDITGIDFAMPALFLVMFVNQWEKEKNHFSSLCGLLVSALCLVLFGPERFIVAAMAGILVMLVAFRKPIERKEAEV